MEAQFPSVEILEIPKETWTVVMIMSESLLPISDSTPIVTVLRHSNSALGKLH